MQSIDLSDEEIIRRYENQLLKVMKTRYEKYPTKRNDIEWLDFTNHVCRRRCQRVHENEELGKML